MSPVAMPFGPRLLLPAVLVALALLSAAPSASADVKHVVARGHTVSSIARRYHVSPKAILDANRLRDADHLKVGSTLIVPGVRATPADSTASTSASGKGKAGAAAGKGAPASGRPAKPTKPPTYAMRPKTPGVIHAARFASKESFTLRVTDRRGRASPTALKAFERLLRSSGGLTHKIEPRLLALLGVVSDHFGSRKIEVISGFRPYTPSQRTRHSNHNEGKAIDFRVVGVPNEVLRDYCRTLRNVGVGYYPNSTFIHLDVRSLPAFWIDFSRPGEPPRYNHPNVQADEGTSDVGDVPPPSEESGPVEAVGPFGEVPGDPQGQN